MYDPQELFFNPEGFESDLSQDSKEFKVRVMIALKKRMKLKNLDCLISVMIE
ncbi:MAG: hypothetical protein ACTSO4_14445 [Promethearchaeota archaeon]